MATTTRENSEADLVATLESADEPGLTTAEISQELDSDGDATRDQLEAAGDVESKCVCGERVWWVHKS